MALILILFIALRVAIPHLLVMGSFLSLAANLVGLLSASSFFNVTARRLRACLFGRSLFGAEIVICALLVCHGLSLSS
jgi:hypothetical protein